MLCRPIFRFKQKIQFQSLALVQSPGIVLLDFPGCFQVMVWL